MTPLGEILTERKEEPDPSALAFGDIPIVAKISFSDGQIYLRPDGRTKTKMIMIYPGDLVLSGINAAKGAIAIYNDTQSKHITATIHYGAYIVNKDRADIRFLWWLLRSDIFRGILEQDLQDGIKMELKSKRLLPISVPLPSLPEQSRIVARIEDLTGRVEKVCHLRKEAIGEAKGLLERAINDIFEGLAETYDFLKTYLLDKPRNGWSPPLKTHAEGGTPVLTLSAITGFNYDRSKVKYTSAETKPDAHYWLKPGELLITRSNTPELVGHAAIYDGSPARCICPDLIMKMSVNQEKADTRFIHYWLQTRRVREYIRTCAQGTSGTMKKIKQSHVEEIPVPRIPMERQHRIVEYLNNLRAKADELIRIQTETDGELAAFTPALLAKAFRGEL